MFLVRFKTKYLAVDNRKSSELYFFFLVRRTMITNRITAASANTTILKVSIKSLLGAVFPA